MTLRINVNDPFWTDRIRSTVRMENIDAQFNRFTTVVSYASTSPGNSASKP